MGRDADLVNGLCGQLATKLGNQLRARSIKARLPSREELGLCKHDAGRQGAPVEF